MTRRLAVTSVLLALALAGTASAGQPALTGTRIEADLFAREGADILYAIGHVRLQRGKSLITADGAVLWLRDREAYLEGRVHYRTGGSVVQAERAYVHWSRVKDPKTGEEKTEIDRGFIVHPDVRWNERPDSIPWRIRAGELVQTDVDRFVARGRVSLSPCLFHEPHAYFRAAEVVLVADDRIIIKHMSYHVQGVALDPDIQGWWGPPVYWPYLYVPLDYKWPEIRFQVGSSDRYGTFARGEVVVGLADRVGPLKEPRVGFQLDYFSARGVGTGGSILYGRRGDDIRGDFNFYRLADDEGKDREDFTLSETDRFRWKGWHSQDTPEGFEFDFEFQRWSDAGFRHEFFERELYDDKPIENRFYFKRTVGTMAQYIHVRWQPDDWLDTTEHLPQVGFNIVSYPLAPHLVYTGHFEVAYMRRNLSDLRLAPGDPVASNAAARQADNFWYAPLESTEQEFLGDDESFWRFNMYHELAMPFEVGILDVEPFVGYRGTYYSELAGGGSGWRSLVVWGARVSTQFWKRWDDVHTHGIKWGDRTIFPLELDGLRHVVTPELRILAVEDSGVRYNELILTDDDMEIQPTADIGFDGFRLVPRRGFAGALSRPRLYHAYDTTALAFGDVNDIHPFRVVNVGLRNRWQTHRRGHVVDVLDIDLDADFFFGDQTVNNGANRSDLRLDLRFRPVHGITFFTDVEYNFNGNDYLRRNRDGTFSTKDNPVTIFNAGLAIATSKRWQLVLSDRYEADAANKVGVRLIYHPSAKWRFIVQYSYDTKSSDPMDVIIRLTRDLHDWTADFTFEDDDLSKERYIGFSLSPKTSRELVAGLYYTRDLSRGIGLRQDESFQQYDY